MYSFIYQVLMPLFHVLRLNLFLSVEEPLRVGKVGGSLSRKELEILRLTRQPGQQWRRHPGLASQ